MASTTNLAASLIEAGAAGYASLAAGRLIDSTPEVGERFGKGAFRSWKEHLTMRLRELASALVVEEPDLFLADVAWSRLSFAARDVPKAHLAASLETLAAVLDEELPVGSREDARSYLAAAAETLEGPAPELAPPALADAAEERVALSYLEAVLSGDRRRAVDTVLDAVDEGLPVSAVYQRVLATAQRRVGEMWHRWEIGVAQEHFVTATTRLVMALLARRLEARPANGKTVVVAVVPGNAHELAAQALADFFEMDGWRSIHFGGQLPAAEIAMGVDAFEADLLALSLAVSIHIRSAVEVVRRVRAVRPEVKILLGGRVMAQTPGLWRKVGGDGVAGDFEEALAVGAQLTG